MSNDELAIRRATPDDASALRAIYAPYVERTTVSFEYDVPRVDEFRRRIVAISATCPYFVATRGGRIEGYAYAHPPFERAAYAWTLETSVYVDVDSRGAGVGSALYRALLPTVAALGYRNAYAVVVADNEESRRFHAKFDFRLVGVFKNSGYKFGRWLDVAWYERALGEYEREPGAPRAIAALEPSLLDSILSRATREPPVEF